MQGLQAMDELEPEQMRVFDADRLKAHGTQRTALRKAAEIWRDYGRNLRIPAGRLRVP